MHDQGTFIASYANRRDAQRAVNVLAGLDGRFEVPPSPAENGEWAVYAVPPVPPARADRYRSLLRALRLPEPTSW